MDWPGVGCTSASMLFDRSPGKAMTDPEPYRKPPAAPTQASIADADHWNQVVDRAIEEVRTSAGKWRDGLAAVVAVVTGALVVGGPTALKDLAPAFRWLVGG